MTLAGRAFARVVRTTRRGDIEVTETAWATVPLLGLASTLFDPPGHRAVLGPGEHNFDFALPLNSWLVPSLELGSNVNVRYSFEAVVATDARLVADKKQKIALFCPGTFDPDLFDAQMRPLAPPQTVVGAKKFFMSRGNCELAVTVPAAVVRDQVMPVRVRVINRSSKTVKSITLKLVQTTAAVLNNIGTAKAHRFGRVTMPDSSVAPLATREMTFEFHCRPTACSRSIWRT